MATPDTSAHVSGDAVDIGPDATAWLSEHGAGITRLCQIYGNQPWRSRIAPRSRRSRLPSHVRRPDARSTDAAVIRLGDDERVVRSIRPSARARNEEDEPHCDQLAVLGDRLPVEVDDVAESLDVVAPPESSAPRSRPSARTRSPREPRSARVRASRIAVGRSRVAPRCLGSSRRLEDVPPVLRPELGDRRRRRSASGSFQSARYFSANVSVSVASVDGLVASPPTVPEEGPRVDYLSCNAGRLPLTSTGWSSRPSRSPTPRAS